MEEQPGVIVKNLAEAQTEAIGQINRQVLFQPATDGNKNLKFAVAMAPPGAKSAVHSHPGDEVALTLSGSATLRVGDRRLCFPEQGLIPPAPQGPPGWALIFAATLGLAGSEAGSLILPD